MGHPGRTHRLFVGSATFVVTSVAAKEARADYVPPIGTLILAAWGIPAVVAWIVTLRLLSGPVGLVKAFFGLVFGLVATVATYALARVFEADSVAGVSAVVGGIVCLGHVCRATIRVLERATGRKSAELLRRLWRHM